MEKNRYFKTTSGIDPLTYVATSYTAAADIAAFQDTGVVGAIGLFDAETNELLSAAANVPVGSKVYIGSIRQLLNNEQYVERSNEFTVRQGYAAKTVYAAPVLHQITLTAIAAPATIEAGEEFAVVLHETTPGNQPFPVWSYSILAVAGDTVATLLTKMAAQINNPRNPQNDERLVTAVAGATTLQLTAIQYGRHFKVAVSGSWGAGQFTWAVTQQFSWGNGTSDQARLWNKESDIKKGVTHNYPIQALPAEFGEPTDPVVDGTQYTVYLIQPINTEDSSGTPVDRHFRKNYLAIFAQQNVAALITALDNVLNITPVVTP